MTLSLLAVMHAEHLARRARMAGPPTLPAALAPQRPPPFRYAPRTAIIPTMPPPAAELSAGDVARLAVVEHRRRIDELMSRSPPLKGGRQPVRPPVTTLQEITAAVCAMYAVTALDIKSGRRTANVVLPRQIVAYLGKILTMRSLPEIGHYLGDRDHTTILHSVRKIDRLRQTDDALHGDLAALTHALRQGE